MKDYLALCKIYPLTAGFVGLSLVCTRGAKPHTLTIESLSLVTNLKDHLNIFLPRCIIYTSPQCGVNNPIHPISLFMSHDGFHNGAKWPCLVNGGFATGGKPVKMYTFTLN